MNIDKDIEILKDFKEKGFGLLMINYEIDRTQATTMVEMALENVLKELEKQTNIAKKEYNEHMEKKRQLETQINNTHILQSQLDVANAEKIEWKKIAEKLAEKTEELTDPILTAFGKYKKEYWLDWARNEAEKDD